MNRYGNPWWTAWNTLAGLVAGAVGSAVWAVSLALYEPFMQPPALTNGMTAAENGSYWPRDMGQSGMLLAFVGVVLIAGPRLRAVIAGGGLTGVWLAADLWLDRIDVSGVATARTLGAAAAGAFLVTAVIAYRWSARQPDVPLIRHLCALTAGIAALGLGGIEESLEADDYPPVGDPVPRVPDQLLVRGLPWLHGTLAVGFALVAIGLVAPRVNLRDRGRRRVVGAGLAAILLLPLVFWAAVELFKGSELGEPATLLVLLAVPVALVVLALSAYPVPPRRVAVAALTCLGVAPVAAIGGYIGSSVVGTVLTLIAGNPSVNAADTDMSFPLFLAVVGVALGLVSALLIREPKAAPWPAPYPGHPAPWPARPAGPPAPWPAPPAGRPGVPPHGWTAPSQPSAG